MLITKAASGLVAVCVAHAIWPLRIVSGLVAAMLPRRRSTRFVEEPTGFVDGATYEFLHESSTCVRTFFADELRAEAHGTDSFTLGDSTEPYCEPGLRSFQKHLPSGVPLLPGTGAWHAMWIFFGPNRTARIRLVV